MNDKKSPESSAPAFETMNATRIDTTLKNGNKPNATAWEKAAAKATLKGIKKGTLKPV
ncbi:MAG: hypothetical protein H6868_07375 [Rhodospirillales bacterium]|nr:hypothetical protein [Rhodospirillales bacterium]